jgi:peptidoglycan hydrolase CwlO-like protein
MPSLKLFLAPATLALAVAIPCLSFSAPEPLGADTKKSERKYRTTTTGEGALTREMLEACIMLKADIDKEYEKINTSKKAFDSLNEEVKKLAAEIPKNEDDVPLIEYNKQVAFYNSKLDELKKLEAAYNEKNGSYREKTAQLEKECNNQPYYQDDYTAAAEKTGKSL